MLRMAVVASGVLATAVLGVGVAAADTDVHGGHCEYEDASVNIAPSCSTGNIGSGQIANGPGFMSEVASVIPGYKYPQDLPEKGPQRPSDRGTADGDVEGGDCKYGDASLNLAPSCDTSEGSGAGDRLANFTNLFHPRTGQLFP